MNFIRDYIFTGNFLGSDRSFGARILTALPEHVPDLGNFAKCRYFANSIRVSFIVNQLVNRAPLVRAKSVIGNDVNLWLPRRFIRG